MRPLPDQIVNITDDAEAQAFMLELGVLDQFHMRADHPVTVSATVVRDHPTHWILCARHQHNPDPAENGYQVVGYPKSSVPLLAVEMLLQQFLSESTEITVAPHRSEDRN